MYQASLFPRDIDPIHRTDPSRPGWMPDDWADIVGYRVATGCARVVLNARSRWEIYLTGRFGGFAPVEALSGRRCTFKTAASAIDAAEREIARNR